MPIFDWQTFVLQRRINRPSDVVVRTIVNPAVFGAGSVVAGDRDGVLRLDEPFRGVDGFGPTVWRADAHLIDRRNRRIAAVELEIGPWSAIDTQLLIRPRAKRPERWSGRRLNNYFAQAHRGADGLTHLLMHVTADRERIAVNAAMAPPPR